MLRIATLFLKEDMFWKKKEQPKRSFAFLGNRGIVIVIICRLSTEMIMSSYLNIKWTDSENLLSRQPYSQLKQINIQAVQAELYCLFAAVVTSATAGKYFQWKDPLKKTLDTSCTAQKDKAKDWHTHNVKVVKIPEHFKVKEPFSPHIRSWNRKEQKQKSKEDKYWTRIPLGTEARLHSLFPLPPSGKKKDC